ncbi:hypothetical protein LCGC14_2580140 [marine sediment metagenome]|uniref:Uncharacterized protein n=1 Tax=marine sediment metagenome TaxID=412755 RepID=A0A0F9B2K0_9ZZZZ
MKCPLLTIGLSAVAAKEAVEMEDCIKEECAWWSDDLEGCDPTGMLPHIIKIADRLMELVAKMPHEEQFRR